MRKELFELKKWLDLTSIPGRPRSEQLKQIDAGLKAYQTSGSDADLKTIRAALAAWKAKEGAAWKLSKRNAKKAMEELDKRLDAPAVSNFYTRDLAHSRVGLLYLFSKTEVERNLFKIFVESSFEIADAVTGFDPVGDAMGDTAGTITELGLTGGSMLSSEAIDRISSRGPSQAAQRVPSLLQRIRAVFESFARDVWASITEKFTYDATRSWNDRFEDWWPRITGLINFIVDKVASNAAPFVSGGIDLFNGVRATAQACHARYKTYSMSKGVVLNDGHPAVIVDAINGAMNFAIGKGLWDVLKSAGQITADALGGIAGPILSLVTSCCEVIIKVIHRLWEISKMRSFFEDCRERYAAYQAAQASGRADTDAFYHSGVAFAAWYRGGASALPCLSFLALNSGITGDKMAYLNMFSDGFKALNEGPAGNKAAFEQAADTFQRGVAYIDELKARSRDFLVAAGYEFRSDTELVANILKACTASKVPPLADIKIGPVISRPDVLQTRLNGYNRSNLIPLSQARLKFGAGAPA